MAYLVELTAPRVVSVRDYLTSEPDAGEVRVRTLYSGISAGTELTHSTVAPIHISRSNGIPRLRSSCRGVDVFTIPSRLGLLRGR